VSEELYDVRSKAVHRGTNRGRTWGWEISEHLVMAASVYPLVVKMLLQAGGHYTLIEADRTGSGALCQTLETYLGIGNAAAAARALYIHYNTMKHRMVRIVELLDVDLHDPRTRLSLAVALAARALTSGAGSRG